MAAAGESSWKRTDLAGKTVPALCSRAGAALSSGDLAFSLPISIVPLVWTEIVVRGSVTASIAFSAGPGSSTRAGIGLLSCANWSTVHWTSERGRSAAPKGAVMPDLLMLEPRDAGAAVADPVVEFQDGFYAEQGRTRCEGCCVQRSNVEIRTNSYAN
jgi:hypothetical protein